MVEENQEKSFAQLLEDSEFSVGQELKVGDRITGRIIAVGKDQAYVDTGTKTDAVIDKQELSEEDGSFPYQEGDQVELYVISRKHNEIRLGRSMGAADGGLEELEQAMQGQIPVQGKVQQTCKGGFRVRVMGKTAFCPLSQMDIRPIDDPESMVGESLDFSISRVEEKGRNIVVSRRALQEKERKESLQNLRDTVQTGDILSGTVTRLAPFGAFVQVAPGLEGLVHISEMSWTRKLKHPSQMVKNGDEVDVIILGVDADKKRISLGMKQVKPNPWDVVEEKYPEGTILEAPIKNITDFGLFIGIEDGIDGLIHVSDLSWTKKVHHPEELYQVGDMVRAKVLTVDRENEKFTLGVKQLHEDPWSRIPEKYPEGTKVTGKVTNITDFGLFVEVEEGIEGLVHQSEITNEKSEGNPTEDFEVGQEVSAKVIRVSAEDRKLGLSIKQHQEDEERRKNQDQQKSSESTGSNLGDMIRQKLEDAE